MKTFHLTISRVGENLFDGEAAKAVFPGSDGVFTVLPHHEALISTLVSGEIMVEEGDGTTHRFEISPHGMVEVSNNQTTVLL